MNIYVGNLSHEATEEDLKQAFEPYGQVSRATVIKDRVSGEPRGFGFVEMPSKEEAEAALAGLNGQNLKGRSLKISEARPRPERSEGGMGGDRRGGGGGYRGGREY
jgi:RNA recognition motif-containing protein